MSIRNLDSADWVMVTFVVLAVLLIPLAIYGMILEQRKWEQFSDSHHCKVVGRSKGGTMTGVGPNIGGNGGVTITTIQEPDKTGWLCDDGITYWR